MKRNILIHASGDDVHAEAVAKCLQQLGVAAFILLRETCFDDWIISCENDDVIIDLGRHGRRSSQEISGVLWRRDHIIEPAWVQCDNVSPPEMRFLAEQRAIHVESAFKRLACSCKFINDIDANRRSSSKSLQHHLARQCGLVIPKTYIGSDPSRAERFARALWDEGRRCCTKNIESSHVEIDGVKHARLTTLFTEANISDLSGLSVCPMIFQEYIEKRFEYRVTIVGREVFACRIDSQVAGGRTAIDWRNYNLPATPHYSTQLDETLTMQLVQLVSNLGLTYGAIDLVENQNGDFFFLEINSMGQWLWIEDLTELPISMSIARYLIGL